MIRKLLTLPAVALLSTLSALAQTTIDPTQKYAYGANIGWINLAGNGTDGVVVGEYFLSGRAYGANVGWIGFGDGSPADGVAYANDDAADYGVNNDGAGNLSGLAYGANIGWINFGWATPSDPARPRVDLATGTFSGFAYGANVGWINLGAGFLATSSLFCDDEDGDGISDAWETLNFGDTTTANAGTDTDADQVSDREEYFGGSDPNDVADYLRVVSQQKSPASPTTLQVTLDFTTTAGRLYRILVSDDLQGFVDSGLGTFAPDAGGITTRMIEVPTTRQFYRVVAIKPLQQALPQ